MFFDIRKRGWGELCRLIWPRAINAIHHAIGSAIDIKLSDWCVSIINHLNCVITFFITYLYILIQKVRWAIFPCSLPKTQLCNVLCTCCFCRGGMGVWVWAVSVLVYCKQSACLVHARRLRSPVGKSRLQLLWHTIQRNQGWPGPPTTWISGNWQLGRAVQHHPTWGRLPPFSIRDKHSSRTKLFLSFA